MKMLLSEVHSSLSSHFWFPKWGLLSISSQCRSAWSELICHISTSFTTLSFDLTLFGLPLNAGFEFDYIFDWTIIKYQQSQRTKSQPRVSVSNLLTTIYWELAFMKLAFIWFIFPDYSSLNYMKNLNFSHSIFLYNFLLLEDFFFHMYADEKYFTFAACWD